jgi:hypothetical protein
MVADRLGRDVGPYGSMVCFIMQFALAPAAGRLSGIAGLDAAGLGQRRLHKSHVMPKAWGCRHRRAAGSLCPENADGGPFQAQYDSDIVEACRLNHTHRLFPAFRTASSVFASWSR